VVLDFAYKKTILLGALYIPGGRGAAKHKLLYSGEALINFYSHEFCFSRNESRYRRWISRVYT